MKTSVHNSYSDNWKQSRGSKPFFQPKHTFNQPNDIYGQEADAVADKVMQMPNHSAGDRLFFKPAISPLQRKCKQCEEEKQHLQRNATNDPAAGAKHESDNFIESLSSSGQPLSKEAQSFFEPRFDHDFSNVKVHTGAVAAKSAESVNALAYTSGNHIVFNNGQYSPDTENGKRLFAHELMHTIQQSSLPGATVQRRPGDDPIHDQLLNDYSDYAGQPRDTVAQHDPGYEQWLQLTHNLTVELQFLIDDATWPQIRKRVYPKESAAGIQRAKDRHAGKLPDLTGLGRLTSLDHFAAALKGVQSRWVSLSAPDDKVKAIGKAANDELTAAQVPSFKIVNKEPMEFKGYFSSVDWRFAISEQLVLGATLTNDDAAEVANTALHESRHAEQHFLAARYSAGINNLGAAALAVEQHIPDSIAAVAVTNKFDSKTNAATKAFGQQMYQATVTDRLKNSAISNDDGWNDMADRRKEAQAALQVLSTGATAQAFTVAEAARDALKAQITVVEQKYAQYRRIPYEADAHELGDAAEEAFRGWPAAAVPTP